MSVGERLACTEGGDAFLFFNGKALAAVYVGKSAPRLDADVIRAADLPDKQMLKVGKLDLYSARGVGRDKRERARDYLGKNYGVNREKILLKRECVATVAEIFINRVKRPSVTL